MNLMGMEPVPASALCDISHKNLDELRQAMGRDAVKAAQSCGYEVQAPLSSCWTGRQLLLY